MNLSPGKWRGLKTTSSSQNCFAILAFDQRGSYRRMLPDDVTYGQAVDIKTEVVATLSLHATAVLLDPVYGLKPSQQMAGTSGLLMAVEKTGYSGDAIARSIDFIDDWSVATIKQIGASAVKMLAYYHPDGGAITDEIDETVKNIADQCKEHDIAFFLEPVSYSIDPNMPKSSEAFAEQRPEIVRQTVKRLTKLGADVLKVEFPVDAAFNSDESAWQAACEALTAEATVPWALLSAGVDFDTFVKQVRVAANAGSSGFLAGRAIWKECIAMSPQERTTFLKNVATPRLQEIRNIVEESGRPWTDYFTPIPAAENWWA